ncbi:hypothetical protein A3K82_01955 [Candidatus Pacearchaeota archaeon RBG_19FT_COMBO_34_9]|nr:MAG: hypothetical protein A3K82_01955 [Candidatus Pacearchaeota archaeon RBG_19FT_COMBO_34_9]OGJ16744.1 MAG: hypothetical protein A3K74_00825 [Candidatus Pacearchaeota archaeon RBG_13_33_26]
MKHPKPFEIKLIASPEDYTPIREDFNVIGAFNPGVTSVKTDKGLETILYVRIAEKPAKNPVNKILLPFFHISNRESSPVNLDYDIVDKKDLRKIGKKEVVLKHGDSRLKHLSLPRMVVLDENRNISERKQEPIISPAWEYERFGIEDVRITHFEDGRYLITYSMPHRDFGVRSHILSARNIKDLRNLEGITSDNTPRPEIRGKDAVLFPEKAPSPLTTGIIKKGEEAYVSFIRPNDFSDLSIPGIWISYSPDLVHWGQDHRLTVCRNGEVTGTGSPPVKRQWGWLEAFHETTKIKGKINYATKLMALDLKEPWKVMNISDVLLNREDFRELLPKDGYIPNIVFTSGMVVDRGRTDFYQGIDDKWTAMASFYTDDIDKFAKAD